MSLEHRGGKRRGAGRKTAAQEELGAGGSATGHGGKRPGAGRAAVRISAPVEIGQQTPEEFLGAVMNDAGNPTQFRMDAAELLMRYGRVGGARGKKALIEEAARDATKSGRFATPAEPPTLVVNNGR